MKTSPLIHTVSSLVYLADMTSRRELGRVIGDERDYVSAFATRIRDQAYRLGLHAYYHARGARPDEEKTFGCDAMIILRFDGGYKVCLFEAKWPRYGSSHKWDYQQKSSKQSHFSDQIRRQHNWRETAAIWEMFLLEERSFHPSLYGFDHWGATCVWHELAWNHVQKRGLDPLWDDAVLSELVKSVPKDYLDKNQGVNVREMLLKVSKCKAGKLLTAGKDNKISLVPEKGDSIDINIGLLIDSPDYLGGFTGQHGIAHLLFLDLAEAG